MSLAEDMEELFERRSPARGYVCGRVRRTVLMAELQLSGRKRFLSPVAELISVHV